MYLQAGRDDEDRWISRCLGGDTTAFEPLVERYHRPLFRVAARMLGNHEEAQDVTQTAFLKAFQALATCDRQRRFFSWIYRILVNECLNVLRARRRSEPIEETVAAAQPQPDTVEVADTRRAIREALLKLTESQREVILLRHFADMTYEQMSGTLGVPEKTVKSRLFSARQRLCELLAGPRV